MVRPGDGDHSAVTPPPSTIIDQDVIDSGTEPPGTGGTGPGGQAPDTGLLPGARAPSQVLQRGMVSGGVEVAGHDEPSGRVTAQ